MKKHPTLIRVLLVLVPALVAYGGTALFGSTTYIKAAVVLAAWIVYSFIILYAIRSPWRLSIVGRSLMWVWISLGTILTLNSTSIWFPDYPFRTEVRVLVYTYTIEALAYFLFVLVGVQGGRIRGEIPPNRLVDDPFKDEVT